MKFVYENKIKKFITPFLLGSIFLISLSSCYRMPTEDDYSLIPMTNNPSVTRERGNQLIPNNSDF